MNNISIRELTVQELKMMQLLQLDILKEFDRICRKHNIKYTLCGGSMLGAIRHKGFIPWDDDIDVSLLREDYIRFCELCKTELNNDKYFLQTMDTDNEYRLTYGRILLNGTTFIRAGQEHIKAKNGIFIDIFPRDGVSDNFIIMCIQSILGFLMRKTLYSPVGKLRGKSWLGRCCYRILSFFPLSFAKKVEKLIIRLNFSKATERVCCYGLMGAYEKKKLELGKKEYRKYKKDIRKASLQERQERKERDKGFKRIFFEQVSDVDFEDMKAMVSDYYDIWLTTNYDDYMKLPPKEKQVMHQTVSSFDLGDYKEKVRDGY